MRRFIPLLLLCALPALADSTQPSGLQPLPEPPAAPPGYEPDASLEPEVTITKRGEDRVEEYRIHGKLYMLKVTPPHGKSYYLIDDSGAGRYSRSDDLSGKTRVPMWVLGTF
jgi:hypothetical protein